MAIKKFNRHNYLTESDPDALSKTQQKNESIALKKFGLELTDLPAKKLAELPVSEVTLNSLLDYQKITSNLARKRHLMFIGKCIRNEDEEKIRAFLETLQTSHSVAPALAKSAEPNPIDTIIKELVASGEGKIESLLADNPSLERQTLRQILRNIKNAKKDIKKAQAVNKLKQYLVDNERHL